VINRDVRVYFGKGLADEGWRLGGYRSLKMVRDGAVSILGRERDLIAPSTSYPDSLQFEELLTALNAMLV
jgi:hypothetical protein